MAGETRVLGVHWPGTTPPGAPPAVETKKRPSVRFSTLAFPLRMSIAARGPRLRSTLGTGGDPGQRMAPQAVDNAVDKPVEEGPTPVEEGVESRDRHVEERPGRSAYAGLTRDNGFPPDVERRKLADV